MGAIVVIGLVVVLAGVIGTIAFLAKSSSGSASATGADAMALGASPTAVATTIPGTVAVQLEGTNKIHISGADKQAVGEFAARVRKVRKPEPYKGKGIRYEGEQVKIKPGKAFAGAGAAK